MGSDQVPASGTVRQAARAGEGPRSSAADEETKPAFPHSLPYLRRLPSSQAPENRSEKGEMPLQQRPGSSACGSTG